MEVNQPTTTTNQTPDSSVETRQIESVKSPVAKTNDQNTNENPVLNENEQQETENLTKQMSLTWTGNGQENLQRSLSNVKKTASNLGDAKELPIYSSDIMRMSADSGMIDGFVPFSPQQSYNMGEARPNIAFSNVSSIQYPYGVHSFSRNPSDSNSFVRMPSNFSPYDMIAMNIPAQPLYTETPVFDMDYLHRSGPMEASQLAYGMDYSAVPTSDLNRQNSVALETMAANDLKRNISQAEQSVSNVSAIQKMVRQNTENQYLQTSMDPHGNKEPPVYAGARDSHITVPMRSIPLYSAEDSEFYPNSSAQVYQNRSSHAYSNNPKQIYPNSATQIYTKNTTQIYPKNTKTVSTQSKNQSISTANIDDDYAETYQKVLTGSVNGVAYTSTMYYKPIIFTHSKKKDKKNPNKWTAEEDELLRQGVKEFGEKQWKDIAARIPGRNHVQCLQRWKKVLKPGLKKGHWLEEEDELLRVYQSKCGNWAEVASNIPGRTAKQCRERWHNHVNPEIKKGDWTIEEDNIIISLQKQWGNRWSSIADQLPGRSENAVKIRWKTLSRKGIPENTPTVPLKNQKNSSPKNNSNPSSPVLNAPPEVQPVLAVSPMVVTNQSYSSIPNQPYYSHVLSFDRTISGMSLYGMSVYPPQENSENTPVSLAMPNSNFSSDNNGRNESDLFRPSSYMNITPFTNYIQPGDMNRGVEQSAADLPSLG